MNSSGIKRGLAVAAISALAVTGVPTLANAATLTQQEATPLTVNLRSLETGGVASVANDGTNTTISLVATGGSSVEYVSFFRAGVAAPIATVSRSANGDFQYEWTPPVGVSNADISAVRTDAAGTPLSDNVVASTDAATNVTISGTAATVEITPKTSLGYFTEPVGGDYGAGLENIAGISGTTSQDGGTLTIDATESVAASGAAIAVGAMPAGQTTQSWNGTVLVGAPALLGDNDQFLPVVETSAGNTRDAQGFNLYAQEIRNITATAAPVLPDSSTTTVTVTVLDQNGQPVAGAKVEAEDANGGAASNAGFTNGLGRVTFTGASAGTHSYYVEVTGADGYTTGVDYRTSVTTTTSRPETIAFDSKDGSAFDIDELETNDIRIQVKDAAGNPLAGQRFFYTWTFAPFVTTVDTTQTTAQTSVVTDANGYATVALPTSAAAFPNPARATTVGNGGTGGAFTLNGYVNRDGSNPGQDPVDLALAAQTVKVGESVARWDGPTTTDRQIETEQTFSGSLKLADGTALVGRTLNVTYTPTAPGNAGFSATQPAGTTRLSATSAQVVTGANGGFSVSITDPTDAANNTAETGTLDAVGTATVGTGANQRDGIDSDANTPDVTVRWTTDAAPRNITLTSNLDPNGAGTADDDPFVEVIGNAATPGRPVSFQVNLSNSQSNPLAGQQVTLKTDHGFFTPNPGAASANDPATGLTADPAPAVGGQYGEWASLGNEITVTTDASGQATVTVAIEKDAGFDDDGNVVANIVATAGTASNASPIQVAFTSADALNPGAVTVEAASNPAVNLPEARVGQQVRYNVFTTDQFGNLTADQVVVSDNTADAGFLGQAGNGTLLVTSQFTSSSPAVTAVASADTEQVITATWAQATNTYVDGDAATAGFQPAVSTNNTASKSDDADAIDWYAVDFAESTFTITSTPEGAVPVGTAVTETVKVVDQKGNPVPNLQVEFIRQGPADQDGDPNITRTTNANGEAFYSFTGTKAGVARISAVVTDGTQNMTLTDDVVFESAGPVDITAALKGRNNGAKADKLRVVTDELAAGAKVKLFKIVNGKRVRVATDTVNNTGKASFTVRDRNGKKQTSYVAKVVKTNDTKGATSNIRRVR